MQKFFEVCARAFIIKNNRILVCRRIDHDYLFFPGGHVEFGEKAEKALKREIEEEIGLNIKISGFIGLNENYFIQDGEEHHEFNIVFFGEIEDDFVRSKEKHLEFQWKNLDSIQNEKIYPIALHKKLLEWIGDRKIFWSD